MKRIHLVVLISITLFLSQRSHAQIDPMVGATAEWTVAGTLVGAYGGVKFNERFGLGALYETRTVEFDSRFNENLSLLGLFIDYRILREGNLDVDIFIRGGLENDKFVVILPALNFEYYFAKKFSGFVMAGVRSEKPSIGVGVFYHFKGRSDR